MKTISSLGGALILSLALSLAGATTALAQARSQGSEPVTGTQSGKPQTPPAACKSEGPIAVCTPQSPAQKPKPPARRTPPTETSK